MANIKDKVALIRNAVYGKDVRESIASGIEAMNTEVESTTERQSLIDDAEQERVIAEQERVTSEDGRKVSEDGRKTAENGRAVEFDSWRDIMKNGIKLKTLSYSEVATTNGQATFDIDDLSFDINMDSVMVFKNSIFVGNGNYTVSPLVYNSDGSTTKATVTFDNTITTDIVVGTEIYIVVFKNVPYDKNEAMKFSAVSRHDTVYTATADVTHIAINDDLYRYETDILDVLYKGTTLAKDVEYTLNDDETIDLIGWTLQNGETLTFRVLKNVLPYGVKFDGQLIEVGTMPIDRLKEALIYQEDFAPEVVTINEVSQSTVDLVAEHEEKINDINSELADNAYVAIIVRSNGTDDTINLQNALNINRPKRVLLPDVNYIISNTLYIPSNTIIEGFQNTTIKVINGSSLYIGLRAGSNNIAYSQNNRGNNIKLLNLVLDGNRANRSDLNITKNDYFFLTFFEYVDGVEIRGCVFKNCVNDALYLKVVKNVVIDNCTIQDVIMTPSVSNNTFQANGISVYGGLGTLQGESTDNIRISNNKLINIDDVAISIAGLDKVADIHNTVIDNNFIDTACIGVGIEGGQVNQIQQVFNATIRNNSIINCGRLKTTGTINGGGIVIDDKSFNCEIINNPLIDNCFRGIIVRGDDCKILNNIITNFTNRGINVSSKIFGADTNVYRTTIKKNTIQGKSGCMVGIYLQGCSIAYVTNNDILNILSSSGGENGAAIYLDAPYNDVYIKANSFNNINYEGIYLNTNASLTTGRVFISSNEIYVNNQFGIYVVSANIVYTHILNNIIVNTAVTVTVSRLIICDGKNADYCIESNNTLIGSVDAQSFIHQNTPSAGKWYRGMVINNTNISYGGSNTEKWVCYITGTANKTAWVTNTVYTVGQTVYSGNYVYQCTVAGTSGTTGPNVTSGTQIDGTVTWKYIDRLAVFKPIGMFDSQKAVFQANSTATDVTTLVSNFNSLLQKLKDAGIMLNS